MRLKDLEKEIEKVKARNRRVEGDKAWETSYARRVLVGVLTYFVIVLFFYFAGLPKPFINSIVPAVGFLLSTVTLSFFKGIWLERHGG
jgi:polyferredoxin